MIYINLFRKVKCNYLCAYMSVIGSSLQRFQEAFSIVVDKGMLNVPLRPPLRNIYEVQNSFPFAILWHPLEIASFVNS